MKNAPLTPPEKAGLEKKRAQRRKQQPYATELDDRELEHAHQDGRPVDPQPAGDAAPGRKPR